MKILREAFDCDLKRIMFYLPDFRFSFGKSRDFFSCISTFQIITLSINLAVKSIIIKCLCKKYMQIKINIKCLIQFPICPI